VPSDTCRPRSAHDRRAGSARGSGCRAAWSVSLGGAPQSEAPCYSNADPDVKVLKGNFTDGNHDSGEFFRKMNDSFAEMEALKSKLRQAKKAPSPACLEEMIDLQPFNKCAEDARLLSSFAACVSNPNCSLQLATENVPRQCGHLSLPSKLMANLMSDGEASQSGSSKTDEDLSEVMDRSPVETGQSLCPSRSSPVPSWPDRTDTRTDTLEPRTDTLKSILHSRDATPVPRKLRTVELRIVEPERSVEFISSNSSSRSSLDLPIAGPTAGEHYLQQTDRKWVPGRMQDHAATMPAAFAASFDKPMKRPSSARPSSGASRQSCSTRSGASRPSSGVSRPSSCTSRPSSGVSQSTSGTHTEILSQPSGVSAGSEISTMVASHRPKMRFKLRQQFTERYTPENLDLFREVNVEHRDIQCLESAGNISVVDDLVIGWLNQIFRMNIQTESQLVEGFPIICMVVIDAIYGGERIRWQDVNWCLSYKAAAQRNYKVLEKIWTQSKMERFREFRVENTNLRFEQLHEAKLAGKLEFLRRLRDWYTVRSPKLEPFNPLRRRCEIMERSQRYGHNVEFPHWIESPTPGELRQHKEATATKKRSGAAGHGQAEFQKDFLGITDVQTM